MADDHKENSTGQILQAFDAISQLYQARATRRTTSLAPPRSGSPRDGDDSRAVDAAVEQERPRLGRRRLSPRSPFWSKPKLYKNENYRHEEEGGDDAAVIFIVKSRDLSLMLPFRSRSKLDKKEDDDYDDDAGEDDDSTNSTNSTATPEADGERKGVMSWGAIRAASSHVGMRRMGCLFSLEVVAAQGLPPSLNGLRVAVTARRKETRDGAVQTMPARVQLGVADFDEALYIRCHLYDTGGGTTGKPLGFEPCPFLVSLIAIHAPELDFGRSTVDLTLFAKEFMDKCQQGERVRQWDMVFPLDGKAKGGELVVNLAVQSIDDGGAGSYIQRKLRRSSISNMLTPKMTGTNTPKMGVSAPGLRGIDSFMLVEPEPQLTPLVEVKEEEQHRDLEREPADEPILMVEVKEDEQQKKQSEPADEPILVAEVKEDEQQKKKAEREVADEPILVAEVKEDEQQKKEPERVPADEPILVVEVKEDEQEKKEPEREPADEPILVAEVKEDEQQNKEPEHKPADEPTPEVEVKGEEQQRETEREPVDKPTSDTKVEEERQRETECKPADEPTPRVEVKEGEQHEKEPECKPADRPNSEVEVKEEEQQRESDCKLDDEPTPIVRVKEEENHKEQGREPADELTTEAEMKEEEQQRESEHEPDDEPSTIVEVEEEEKQKGVEQEPADEPTTEAEVRDDEQQRKGAEVEREVVQKDDESDVPEFDAIDRGVEGQEVKDKLKEEGEANKGFEEERDASLVVGDEVAKAVPNGLEEKSDEATMPNDVSDAVVDAVGPMDAEAARPEEITGESKQVSEQREFKGTSMKPSRPRFKWRTVALLVPIAVTVSRTLGVER